MEKVDQQVISIFHTDEQQPEMTRAMRDIISLAGVMKDLSSEAVFQSPLEMLRFLRIIELIHEEAYGLSEPIDGADTLYYRYQARYRDEDPPSKARVHQIVTILAGNNWISKQTHQIKMMSVGKRMMHSLTRLANDSLAYYLEDDIGRSLFQARRDAEISEAYDDKGISGGNVIASMIRNVKDANETLKERELELLADRNALPQLEVIHTLMADLEHKLHERYKEFQTIEDSLVLSNLMQSGAAVLAEGTSLSLGMINKYLQFMNVQQTPLKTVISPEKVRTFISKMFHPPLESEIPNAHQLFSFMDQGQYDGEDLDGIWMPVKYASPLSHTDIESGIEFLENYEPVVAEMEAPHHIEFRQETLEVQSIDDLVDEASWLLTKASIDTEKIEEYLKRKSKAEIEETIIETSSSEWGDAIRQLLGIAALEANKRIQIEPKEDVREIEKEWEWIQDDDRKFSIRKRQ
ncbi:MULTISPECIES: hypothetical protein [unclassified Sporosarcina]|uniref:hypothetical protein n=1 Tax=unclassified Sporosarcina TaxID=2647733 RepID=UPI00203E2A70|nr:MULTISPECIES: hypothetical protein [unclassified Sporosarcina]GKV64964.1 hypothetical protein NCCP2331_11170 [Sporosarcina sp. NCCP-2331]GLB56599.1 hypothetical protein NCCP2378_23860 [Sporosarcina sp. NCCP-2378]